MPVDRRSFLELAALGFGGALLPRHPLVTGLRGPFVRSPQSGLSQSGLSRSELTFEEFLAEAVPVARELVKDTSRIGEDRYLHALASHAVRLRDVPVPELRDNTFSPDAKARTWIGANEADAPFTVLHWKLEPGAEIRQHPHLYGNVVTLCLEGEVRVRNFECVGVPDFGTKETLRVRRVADQVLQPGSINLVPLEHGYTHGMVAGPEGARGLDITTRTKEWRPTPTLEVSEEPLEEGGAIFEGWWRHK